MKQFKMTRRLCTALLLAVLLAAQALAAVPEYLIPGGNTIGIKLYAKGLLVTQVGADSAAQDIWNTLLARLYASSCPISQLSELSAQREA